jgi:hypothetical protein
MDCGQTRAWQITDRHCVAFEQTNEVSWNDPADGAMPCHGPLQGFGLSLGRPDPVKTKNRKRTREENPGGARSWEGDNQLDWVIVIQTSKTQ